MNNNNNKGDSSSSKNKKSSSSSSSSSPCNNHFYNALISESDQQKKRFQQFHEASLKRIQLKQEIQRRHQLCAENERQSRERTERQTALKRAEECNALRKFYELKSAQLKNYSNTNDSGSLSSSFSSNSTSTSFSFSSSKNSSRSFPSKSRSSSIKKFQAAYKIHSFIKHHIEIRNTQKIIACLIKLRSIQNRLVLLKSINLRVRPLTFDSNNKNKVLPISPNNKAFLLYKDSILKVLNQLDNDFTDELYLVRERKKFIKNIAVNILKELDNERNLQYEKTLDDFVIL